MVYVCVCFLGWVNSSLNTVDQSILFDGANRLEGQTMPIRIYLVAAFESSFPGLLGWTKNAYYSFMDLSLRDLHLSFHDI